MNVGDFKDFIFLGGSPILDFCNTEIIHLDGCDEFLRSREDMISWYNEMSRYDASQKIKKPGKSKFEISQKEFLKILAFRRALRVYFQAVVDERDNHKRAAIITINKFFEEYLFKKALFLEDSTDVVRDVTVGSDNIFMGDVIQWFTSFLKSANQERIKRCSNPNCSHLFYDTSKSNTRSWCSMSSCGNIMKARAFYKRARVQKTKQ